MIAEKMGVLVVWEGGWVVVVVDVEEVEVVDCPLVKVEKVVVCEEVSQGLNCWTTMGPLPV